MDVLKDRRLSDVPVGLLMSSGIDSNLIRKLSKKFKKYYCGGFEKDEDLKYCKQIKIREKITFRNN